MLLECIPNINIIHTPVGHNMATSDQGLYIDMVHIMQKLYYKCIKEFNNYVRISISIGLGTVAAHLKYTTHT